MFPFSFVDRLQDLTRRRNSIFRTSPIGNIVLQHHVLCTANGMFNAITDQSRRTVHRTAHTFEKDVVALPGWNPQVRPTRLEIINQSLSGFGQQKVVFSSEDSTEQVHNKIIR